MKNFSLVLLTTSLILHSAPSYAKQSTLREIKDIATEVGEQWAEVPSDVVEMARDTAHFVGDTTKLAAQKVAATTQAMTGKTIEKGKQVYRTTADTTVKVAQKTADAAHTMYTTPVSMQDVVHSTANGAKAAGNALINAAGTVGEKAADLGDFIAYNVVGTAVDATINGTTQAVSKVAELTQNATTATMNGAKSAASALAHGTAAAAERTAQVTRTAATTFAEKTANTTYTVGEKLCDFGDFVAYDVLRLP